MNLKIQEIKEKKLWQQFLLKENGSFLQSWNWGEFEKSLGKKIWRFGGFVKEEIVFTSQVIKENFPFFKKSFFYIPFGPTFKKDISFEIQKKIFEIFMERLRISAKKEKAIFLKIEPLKELPFQGYISLKRIQPEKTLILNLLIKEDEIFQNFKKRVRYSIRFAKRHGVKVEIKNKYYPIFYQLLKKTAKRQNFTPFPQVHYKNLFNFSDDTFEPTLFLGKYQGKIIVANIVLFFDKVCFYLHSASDGKLSKSLKASDLIMWEQIKEAKRRGCVVYDFWGIDEKKMPGVTFFKRGFGGKERKYPSGKDFIFDRNWYFLYKVFRKIKNLC